MESFIAWKKEFELEMGLTQKKEKDDKNKKLTGRELFVLDKSLNQSDLKFLEEGKFNFLNLILCASFHTYVLCVCVCVMLFYICFIPKHIHFYFLNNLHTNNVMFRCEYL